MEPKSLYCTFCIFFRFLPQLLFSTQLWNPISLQSIHGLIYIVCMHCLYTLFNHLIQAENFQIHIFVKGIQNRLNLLHRGLQMVESNENSYSVLVVCLQRCYIELYETNRL